MARPRPTSYSLKNRLKLVFIPLPQGPEYEEFETTAKKIEDVPFVQTTDAAVAKAAGLDKPGLIAVKNLVGERTLLGSHGSKVHF